MRRRRPIAAARNAYRALAAIHREVDGLSARLAELEQGVAGIEQAVRALALDERGGRERLRRAREQPEHALAWEEERPLISVALPTIGRPELTERSLPSILGQSYGELEVIVVGDGAPAETEQVVLGLGDPRVRYLELPPRTPWTTDPQKLWLTSAVEARNFAVREARGHWLVFFDDDDAMRPRCLELLLELARERRAEVAYGRRYVHHRVNPKEEGAYPPRLYEFSWHAAICHAGLRGFERELIGGDLGVPEDWWLAERMLRAGVRFAMRDDVLCDVYPSGRHLT
jgi:Glycosyltransferase like family 2